MQVASSEADWSSRGIKLFKEGNFEMVAIFFERAQDLYRAKWAKTAGLSASVDRMRGMLFFLEKCGDSMLEDAVDCFSLAGCWSIAAEVYDMANYYTKCLSMCTTGNLFKMGFQYIKIWRVREDPDADLVEHQELKETKQLFLERAAIHYHELKDTKNMIKFFSDLQFSRAWGYLDELMLLREI